MAQFTVKLLIIIIIITYRGSTSLTDLEIVPLPALITGTYYYWGECSEYPRFKDTTLSAYQTYRPVYDATMNCKDNEWIVDWYADDVGKLRNLKNCTPVPASEQEGDCSTCICAHEPLLPDCTDVDGYYWGLSESNISENKVLMGITTTAYMNYLNIWAKYVNLLSDGTIGDDISWEFVKDDLLTGIKCNRFSNNLRTFYLDDVILPVEYVVTGFKFVAIEKTAGRKGWKLQVKGTKYDSSFKLLKGTDQWFDYSNDSNSDAAYKQNRTETGLGKNLGTNRYLRLISPTFHRDIPNIQKYWATVHGGTEDNLPLQGVRLTYKTYSDPEDAVYLEVIPHRSLIHTPTTPPVETVTEITTETTTEAPTTIPIETTVAPKIISSIKLRTTTTTTTTIKATRYMMFNISTQSPPTIQPKLKRLRTHPVNVSCKSEFKVESGQEENVDLLEELFIPDERGENSGTEFSNSQLSFICPLLLSIFL